MDELRAVLVPTQPGAALSGLFLRRLRGRRLWPRPRAARQRWRAGAALGRVARRLGRGLCAVGAADVADGRRPQAPLVVQTAAALGFVLACAAGCFVLLALCLRFAAERTRILDSLSVNAYSMYLLHYVFIVWLQYALLPVALFAVGKAAIVFGGTLALSWSAAVALRQRGVGQSSGPGEALAARELRRCGAGQFGQAGRFAG